MAQAQRNRDWLGLVALVCRVLFAVTFIVSGALKAIDPWGTFLSMRNYFVAYSLDMPVQELGMSLSILLGGFELALGVMLLLNVARSITSIVALALMPVFTIITLLSATAFPIEDCGCFGELIKLTPWQSFAKNIVLLLMAVVVWYYHRKEQFSLSKKDIVAIPIIVAAAMSLGVYSYRHLPIFDTLPYKKGVNIAEEMAKTRAQQASERVVLVYRNNVTNKLHEFSVEDTEWQNDSLWTWEDTRLERMESKTAPTVVEFYVGNNEGDKTAEVLSAPRIYMLFMATMQLDNEVRERFDAVERHAEQSGVELVYVTPEDISSATSVYPILNMDPKTMKTMLRADYGLIVLEEGEIVEKYNFRDIPY